LTDIIGKSIEEIRELDPDVDELSERELCYIVALGTKEAEESNNIWIPDSDACVFFDNTGVRPFYAWPDYTSSWEHAGRLLEALPSFYAVYPDGLIQDRYDAPPECPECDVINVCREGVETKKSITKAAAKCVLEGIELEVSQ